MRIAAMAGLALLLAGCGTQSPLTPPEGASLPVAPYGRQESPTAEELLRRDAFDAFMADRQKRLLALIEKAMGKTAYTGDEQEEGIDVEADADAVEAEMVMTV